MLREIEQRETISEQQLGAALAYLEVLWIEAGARARETEAARVELDALGGGDQSLAREGAPLPRGRAPPARRVERRVDAQLAVPPDAGRDALVAQRGADQPRGRPTAEPIA